MKELLHAFKVDNTGYVIDSIVVSEEEMTEFDVTIPFPIDVVLWKPRWVNGQWVEGETEEERNERESLQSFESLKPTQQELDDAQLEIKILTLLSELEMI